jgi:hypothetical protein
VSLLLLGNAPPWLAVLLWVAVSVAAGLLCPAIIRQANREQAERDADRQQLDDLARRVDDIERYLSDDEPEG